MLQIPCVHQIIWHLSYFTQDIKGEKWAQQKLMAGLPLTCVGTPGLRVRLDTVDTLLI